MLTKDDFFASGPAFIDEVLQLLTLMHGNESLDSVQIENEVEFYFVHGEPEIAVEGAASMINSLETVPAELEEALHTIADGLIDLPKFYSSH